LKSKSKNSEHSIKEARTLSNGLIRVLTTLASDSDMIDQMLLGFEVPFQAFCDQVEKLVVYVDFTSETFLQEFGQNHLIWKLLHIFTDF
jgi:hypothetical protein